jgi:hypothetical protein
MASSGGPAMPTMSHWAARAASIIALAGLITYGLLAAYGPSDARAFSDVIGVTTTEDLGLTDNPNYCTGEGEGGEVCPLRAALENASKTLFANVDDIVVAAPAGRYVLNAAKGPLPLGDANPKSCVGGTTCPVTLQGAGAGQTVIDGHGATGVIRATLQEAGGLTGVSGVTLTGGAAGEGGAILDEGRGAMTVRESLLEANKATANGGAVSGFDSGAVTLIDSSVRNNSASQGGGLYIHKSPLTLIRSTVSENHATVNGGGIALAQYAGPENGTTVIDSTIAANTAGTVGGGVDSDSSSVSLRYSTVAANTAGIQGGGLNQASATLEGSILAGDSPNECSAAASAATVSANLVFGPSACTFVGPAPLGGDPKLGSLSANGGLGATMALLRGSAALNIGGVACAGAGTGSGAVDERGRARPQGPGCDLGAFESSADTGVTLAAAPDPAGIGSAVSLDATITDFGSEPVSGTTLTVPVPAGAAFLSAPAGCTVAISSTTTVTCQAGSLAPSQSRTLSIAVRPERSGAMLETASVFVDQADDNPANDTATTASVVSTPPSTSAGTTLLSVTSGAILTRRTFTLDAHGRTRALLACPARESGDCRATLTLYASAGRVPAHAAAIDTNAKRTALALSTGAHADVAAARSAFVRLTLNPAGRRLARAHSGFSARLLLSTRLPSGAVVSHTYVVTCRRASRRHHR